MVQKTAVKHILPTFKVLFLLIFKSIKRNNYRIMVAKWIDVVGKQIP